ncbi:MAG TPA: hypothetical protein VMA98_10300 [Candidatus Acidoferrales bacterium]|nr:hypothetical protein [Candidatus Acidoferrales bacterium]
MLHALLLAVIHSGVLYHTYIRPRFESFGYGAEMRLTIDDGGYVNGTYRTDTGGHLSSVHGGTKGSHIWFDIATLGGIHIEGTMKGDGSIQGLGSSLGAGGKQWVFTATPEVSPSP